MSVRDRRTVPGAERSIVASMSRDTLNAARGNVVLAVLIGGFALFQLWRALDVGGGKWIDTAAWGALAVAHVALAVWNFRRARS